MPESQQTPFWAPQGKNDGKHPLDPSHETRPVSEDMSAPRAQPQHPPVLAALSHPISIPTKTFGALPYPEWRLEVAERAQRAGIGRLGKALEWLTFDGCGQEGSGNIEVLFAELKKATLGQGLKNKRRSTHSYASGGSGGSDHSRKSGYGDGESDSGEESSEAEWQGWIADLHRQGKVQQARRERDALQDAQDQGPVSDAPPKNPAEDQRRFLESLRALEPSAYVTSSGVPAFHQVGAVNARHSPPPSTALSSPSSSESLAHRHRARALSFGISPVDPPSSATTPSSQSHHAHSLSPHHRTHRNALPNNASGLYHSASMHAGPLRADAAAQEPPPRRPSMPVLTSLQTFSLQAGAGSAGPVIAPQSSVVTRRATLIPAHSPSGGSTTTTTTTTAAAAVAAAAAAAAPSLAASSTSIMTAGTTSSAASVAAAAAAAIPRRASSAGTRTGAGASGVGGSLGRSASVLVRPGGLLRKKEGDVGREDKGKAKAKTRAKEKEKEKEKREQEAKDGKGKGRERPDARKLQRPKLSLAAVESQQQQQQQGAGQVPRPPSPAIRSPTAPPASRSILRHAKSGSSLKQGDEPLSPTVKEGSGKKRRYW